MTQKIIITPEQRLQTYEKCLSITENTLPERHPGLCVLIRDEAGYGWGDFIYHYTPNYFPEFGCYYPSTYSTMFEGQQLHEWRLNTLKNCIKDIKEKLSLFNKTCNNEKCIYNVSQTCKCSDIGDTCQLHIA